MAERITSRRVSISSSSSSSSSEGGSAACEEREREVETRPIQPAARVGGPRRESQEIRVSYPRNWGGKVVVQSRTPSNEEPPSGGVADVTGGGDTTPVNIDNDITHTHGSGVARERAEISIDERRSERSSVTAAEGRPPQLLHPSARNLKRARARVTRWEAACPDNCGRVCAKRRQKPQ